MADWDKQDIAGAPPASLSRFQIESRLGAGAMGVVYRAFDPQLGSFVALKRIHEDDPARQQRLLREAHALSRVHHPNVVRVYDFETLPDGLYIAMELVEGMPMDEWVQNKRPPMPAIMAALIGAGSALAGAHSANVIHGDFKPGNVVVSETGVVKLVDFGLARLREGDAPDLADPRMTMLTAGRAGTPAYMALEQLRGIAIDERSDQFSFCVTAFELLSGRRAFEATSAVALERQIDREAFDPGALSHLPKHIRAAIVQGLRADRSQRHASMADLIALLAAAPPTRWKWAVAASAAVLAAGAALAAYITCN